MTQTMASGTERIVAFANIWATASREELSIDLMRFAHDAPGSTMETLFVELFLWGQANGFQRFALGMAPLSGMAVHRLSPWWSKAASLVFRFGEHFYGFRGLRAFKDKFDPTWRPRYVAVANDLALPTVFAALARLTSGGVVGLLRK